MTLNKLGIMIIMIYFLSDYAMGQTLWLDDFENSTSRGWTFEDSWTLATGNAAHSGLTNLQHRGSAAATLQSPSIDLSQASTISISYFGRRSGSYPQNGLRVMASIDGGTSFNILVLDSLHALPANSGSSYYLLESSEIPALSNQSNVRFRFEAEGGSSGASVMRIDDFSILGQGIIPRNSITLSSPETSALGTEFEVDLELNLQVAGNGVSGLEFEISFCPDLAQLSSFKLSKRLEEKDWKLDAHSDSNFVRIIILSQNGRSLDHGSYPGLLNMEFLAYQIGQCQIAIESVLASESVPDGSDIPVDIEGSPSTTRIRENVASFEISIDSLDLGWIRHEHSTDASFWIFNRDGSGDLHLRLAPSTSAMTAHPSEATISSKDSLLFSINLDARVTDSGAFDELIKIDHNGPETEYHLPVLGNVFHWRGDSNINQLVDLQDLVHSVNMVVGRHDATSSELIAADNYPFDDEDGQVDVRDLTVFVFALLHGKWPDDSSLPTTNKREDGSRTLFSSASVKPIGIPNSDGLTIYFEESDQIQAVYFEGNSILKDGISFFSQKTDTGESARSIAFKLGDHFNSSDTLHFDNLDGPVFFDTAYAVTRTGEYKVIDLTSLLELPKMRSSISVFPNPISVSKSPKLSINISDTLSLGVELGIYSILGQKLDHLILNEFGHASWDPRGRAPGIYFIRTEGADPLSSNSFILLE